MSVINPDQGSLPFPDFGTDEDILKSIQPVEAKALGGVDLSEIDLAEFSDSEKRVFMLLSDREWHSAEEIRIVAGKPGKPASEGLRRLRNLRGPLGMFGFLIDSRIAAGRLYEYRIVKSGGDCESSN